MDLRTSYPRSVRIKLAGYVHLARMVDKARAALAGTLGEYIYPCPMDKRFLEFAGISTEEFLEAVRDRPDEAIADWIGHRAKPHTDAEREAWNRMMLTRGPDTEEKWAYFKSIRDRVDPTRTDITSWADLLDLEEGRAVPLERPQ
ncbi:MAG: DUF5069 domain-containing protein [Nitrospirota bacterium]